MHHAGDLLQEELQAALGDAFIIERELGGGGMSRVFVATDRALGRRLVVKVPPVDTVDALSVERFEREIQVSARLQHPHIVPLIATAITKSGAPFYTMPFVPGESLRARLDKGTIPRHDTVRILRDVASALAYAHKHGVVHRDIKPENILLHDDTAVITDFGIAKARDLLRSGTSPIGVNTLTGVGMSLGTPAYMAPEQAAGDQVDHRADIYAWALIAYELLSGAHPFAGKMNTQQLIAAQISETPAPLSPHLVGAELSALIAQCLSKNPDGRVESAAELVQALDRPAIGYGTDPAAFTMVVGTSERAPGALSSMGSVAERRRRWGIGIAVGVAVTGIAGTAMLRYQRPAAGVRTIAVLSFENKSSSAASDYLVEGLSDELRSRLTGVAGLSVKGRASSAQFSGGVDVRNIARTLGVTQVLTGKVSRLGDSVRVSAELDDATTGNVIWEVSLTRDVRELANVRDSLAALVIGNSRNRPSTDAGGPQNETASFDAYDQFLQGQHAFARLDFVRAASHYREAVRLDSLYARAWASLTIAIVSEPRRGVVPRDSAIVAAQASLARTMELAPTAPLARVADASVRAALFKFQEAAVILEDVIAHDPQDIFAQQQYLYILGSLGRVDEALAVNERIRRIDPLNPFAGISREYVLMGQHRFQESADAAHRDLDLRPGDWISLRNLSVDYVFLNKPDSAVMAMEAAWRTDSVGYASRINLAFAYAAAGRWSDVDRLEAEGRKVSSGNSPEFFAAEFDIMNGRYDSAMRHVERGVAAREPLFATAWLSCDPGLDVLKGNAHFAAVVATIGARMCPRLTHWPIPARR